MKSIEISMAVALMRSSQTVADDEIFETLVQMDICRRSAARLIEYLPMAYCRAIFADTGVRFSDLYRRALDVRHLSSDPEWELISEYVDSEMKCGASPAELIAIAGRSAEFQAVNEMLNQGADLESIVLTEAVLNWPESGPESRSL